MYGLFTHKYTSNNSVIRPGSFRLVDFTLKKQIQHILDYYHSRVFAIESNHLLCRLLTIAGIPFQYDLNRYTDLAFTRSPYIAKHFNFTSDITYGTIFDGLFYGNGNTEIIIAKEEYFDPYDAIKDWENIEAIRVLDHNVSNTMFLVPDGRDNNIGKGLVVIEINIPLLLIQYRGFVEQQYNKIVSGNVSQLAVTHFVRMYALPNMLKSHSEIVLLNRFMNLFYGAPMDMALKHYPFPLIDYSDKLDRILLEIIKHVKDRGLLYFSVLKNIPSIYKEDMQAVLLMPDVARTRQVWWSLLLTRLKVIKFLIDIGGEVGIHANGTYINKLKIDLRRLLEENILKNRIPADIYYDYSSIIEDILNIGKGNI